MSPGIRSYGDHAVMVELDSSADVLALDAALNETRPVGVIDIVPAARTVTVVIHPRALAPETAAAWIANTEPRAIDGRDDEIVDIDVDYSGEDLAEVARLSGMTVAEVIDVHASSTWRVAFGGFAPGFGYLVTDHDRLRVPRRATPRTSVPAGSVALAGEFGGIYPRSGPGGWQVIGHTDAVLWDESRDPAALLRPGVRVRFRALPSAGRVMPDPSTSSGADEDTYRDRGTDRGAFDAAVDAPGSTGEVAITVVDPGMQALVEDLGRPGNASIGAARSGALDRAALRLGNRLLGNDESAAAVELLYGGARLRFERPSWFAVTGARGPLELGADGIPPRTVEPDAPTHAGAGETLSVGPAEDGMRYMLAVRGGIRAREVLGSASRDVGAGIGPAPLTAGDILAVDAEPATGIPAVDALTVPPPPSGTVVVHVRPGPRADWFAPASIAAFYETEWRVSAESNRIGVRLTPPREHSASAEPFLVRATADELPSEAMVPGAIQVPPNGLPVVLLADHPVTGGYPVIAVVADDDLDVFAQLRPGQGVRFRHAR